jgi:predicted ATPase
MKFKIVTLRRYKSIAKLEAFELRNLNVLFGANGAGRF